MDTIVRNEIVGGTNVLYCPKVSADGTETEVTSRSQIDKTSLLRVKDVFKAAAELKAMNAPKIDGYYVGIIHPYVAYDLMQEAGNQWMEVQKYATPENMLKGEIGCLGGVRFVESTEAKIWNAGENDCGVFATLILGADAYGVTSVAGGGIEHIVKQKGYGDDPLNQRSSIGWKGLKTAKRLVEEYMIRIESGSTFSLSAKAN
jgi:N4-gp56 family major capsid protein